MSNRKANKALKGGLTKTKSGLYVGAKRHKEIGLPPVLTKFGCLQCPWAGNSLCPHGISAGGHHSNWICSFRAQYMQKEMERIGNVPRLVQNEEAIKLKMVTDKMLMQWAETGELDGEFKHLNKNLISLIDKMRKQDEGLKIQSELNVVHEDFRKIVDIEAKKLEERDNRIRQAKFSEEVQDN